MRKGQGRRHLLDARGIRALRRHSITHRHDSVIDITKWAQEFDNLSPNLTFLLEITDAVSSIIYIPLLKRRATVQRVISVQFKSQHL